MALAGLVPLLLLIAWAARSGSPVTGRPLPLGRRPAAGAGSDPPASFGPIIPVREQNTHFSLLFYVAMALVLVGIVLLVVLVGWLLRMIAVPAGLRRGPRDADDAPPTGDAAVAPVVDRGRLHGEVVAGLEELENTADPRRAVIGCWLRLEAAAAAAGTARLAAEAPGELVRRVLRAHDVRPPPLEQLGALYREARYSGHPIGEDRRRAARAALDEVRRDLIGTPR